MKTVSGPPAPWRPSQCRETPRRRLRTAVPRIIQEITVQPHFQKWLFASTPPSAASPTPQKPDSWAALYNGDVLQLSNNSRLEYKSATRHLRRQPGETHPGAMELAYGERLPDGQIDPR